MERKRFRIVMLGAAALAMFAVFAPHNRADIRILMHQQGDRNPHKMQAAIDLGMVAISVLVTWTEELTR
jgi:hypothetical protein